MTTRRPDNRRAFVTLFAVLLMTALAVGVAAHPLGNFTINHFARIEPLGERVRLHYVVEMAEISTLQELQRIDADGDGKYSGAETNAYLERVAPAYLEGLRLSVDGARVALQVVSKKFALMPGEGGLATLRTEFDFAGAVEGAGSEARRLRFEDANHQGRIGWHEIVISPAAGVTVFDSSAFGGGLSNELRDYPEVGLAAPLNERAAEFSYTRGEAPAGTQPLLTRDGRAAEKTRDSFAELINVPEVTPGLAFIGLLFAMGLGALHALSPGHGKAVVGAYLVGSRGTARHAAFLGLTVTITHTIGVFALGLVTLFASNYILPERLYPVLSLISGGIVLVVGLSLFFRRLRSALGVPVHPHDHDGEHAHGHSHDHTHDHSHEGQSHSHDHTHDHEHEHTHAGHDHAHHSHDGALVHSHGGREHSHMPPGADGSAVTWRSLLGLGISGGLLPCPSALVVMLSAISLGRAGYGLILVLAFSLGLAATLTGVGLAFVYARRLVERPLAAGRLMSVLPVASAFVIACIGAIFCYEALGQFGADRLTLIAGAFSSADAGDEQSLASVGALALLGLGLVLGLKHATEVDHVVALTTIVGEHRSILRAALVGGMWGIGHTASLIVVGAIVLTMRVAIPESVASWLEFAVALMIIWLGFIALVRALRKRSGLHVHQHTHDGLSHAHIHFHDEEVSTGHDAAAHSHAVSRIGFKPLVVGAVHGLAGSAALTLLVLTQIESMLLGMIYLAIFGLGSIAGMLIMSGLVGLPFAFGSRKASGLHWGLQTAAGAFSIAFGLWYAYETGIAAGLLRTIM